MKKDEINENDIMAYKNHEAEIEKEDKIRSLYDTIRGSELRQRYWHWLGTCESNQRPEAQKEIKEKIEYHENIIDEALKEIKEIS